VVRRDLDTVRTAVVGIAASTGGPSALYQLLSALPVDFPVPILLVQHIARGFGQGMVNWLDGATRLQVKTAEQGELLRPGCVFVAPDDRHLLVQAGNKVHLRDREDRDALCPSADKLFSSLADAFGRKGLGVIMTGMGRDGVEGLRRMKDLGGRVLAQDELSCVVFGMPKEAIEAEIVDRVIPLEQMAAAIMEML